MVTTNARAENFNFSGKKYKKLAWEYGSVRPWDKSKSENCTENSSGLYGGLKVKIVNRTGTKFFVSLNL